MVSHPGGGGAAGWQGGPRTLKNEQSYLFKQLGKDFRWRATAPVGQTCPPPLPITWLSVQLCPSGRVPPPPQRAVPACLRGLSGSAPVLDSSRQP